jgi:hypothetical protein
VQDLIGGRSRAQVRSAAARSLEPVRGGVLQRKRARGGTPGPSGECEACRKERNAGTLRRMAAPPSSLIPHPSKVPAIVYEVLRSPGQPVDAQTRAFMEPRFGHDFSRVRLHTDARAAESARAVNALAYTVGHQIVFGANQYVPHAHAGRRLIAHELVHTVQQAKASSGHRIHKCASLPINAPGDKFEREADETVKSIEKNDRVDITTPASPPPSLQRSFSEGGKGRKEPSSRDSQTRALPTAPLKTEFNAFIPGSIGNSFERYPHPLDLKNQKAFEADLKAVKGTWLEEPGSFAITNSSAWYFATDNRSFGGGSRRLGFSGNIPPKQIGSLGGKSNLFNHTTSGSEHVRWLHTGLFTSKNETGVVDHPPKKSATPSHSEEASDLTANESTITTKGSANYPFATGSPDIDYTVTFNLKRDVDGKTRLRFEITKNLFPYYELLINDKVIWKYSALAPGPSIPNLTSSDYFRSNDWVF